MKVRQLENKNQFILEDNNKIIFQSYESTIAIYNKKTKNIVLGEDWDYSNTTRKHFYIFIDEELDDNESTHDLKKTKYTNNRKKAIQKLIEDKKIIVKNI